MNILSLFDGIGCGYEALKKIGINIEKYYASEINKYAISISKKKHPNIIHLGDIHNFNNWNIERPDLIIGGSPCQGFSFAGKQLNFQDERSKLFFKFVDILKFYKPKYFLLENVKMKKEYRDIISKYLEVEPIEINSSLVSAQNRKRLYWTNIPNVTQPKDRKIYLKDILESGVVDRDKSYCIDANYFKGTNLNLYFDKHRRQIVFDKSDIIRKLTPVECERLQTLPDDYTKGISNTQRYKCLGNGWTVDVIVEILKNIDF
jgi:site-specific DNA-cytosine methylase